MLELKRCGVFFLLLTFSSVPAQDPPTIRWKQLESSHYQIIFPEEISPGAKRIANQLEFYHNRTGESMGGHHEGIPIVLRNRSAVSNAYVTLAPWKSEWHHIPLPLKEMGSMEWYELLAIHEGRHMFQFGQMNRRINRLFRILGGEQMQGIANALMVPRWFWEGDAVVSETLLSESGRGRQPYFSREIRALLLDNIRVSYRKALHGSFRDEYPNHYYYGYLMASHANRKYGPDTFPRILDETMKWPFMKNPFFPFSAAANKVTGRSAAQLFEDSMSEFTNAWQDQIEHTDLTSLTVLSPVTHTGRTDYLFPGYDGDGRLYAVKRGLAEATSLVKFGPDGTEHLITQLPNMVEEYGIHIGGALAVWNEIQPDRRWTKQSWSNIVVYDLKRAERRQLTEKVRYFTPALSRDGSRIAAVEFTENRRCFLVILDSGSGTVLKRFPFPENTTVMHPRWSADGKEIVYTSHRFSGRAITVVDVSTGEETAVKTEAWEEVFRPFFFGDYVITESPHSGLDNLHAIHRWTGQRYQITSVRVAASNATVSPDGQELVFNDYTRKGDRIVTIPLDVSSWTPLDSVKVRTDEILLDLVTQTSHAEPPQGEEHYQIEDFNHLASFFNFHSWEIFPDADEPSLSIYSDNILGTASLLARTTYNRNEQRYFSEVRGGYQGRYPILSGGFGWGERVKPDTVDVPVGRADTARSHITHLWAEKSFDVRVTLPIVNRRVGVKREALNLSTTLQKTQTSQHDVAFTWPERDDLPDTTLANPAADGTIFPITLEMNYAILKEGAPRDVRPRRRGEVDVAVTQTPFRSDFKGSRTYLGATLYLSGLFRHDALRLSGAVERKRDDGYPFRSLVEMPLGYDYVFHENVTSLKGSYRAPLLYPDGGLDMIPLFGRLRFGYVKRVSADLLGQWLKGSDKDVTKNYFTVGIGTTLDVSGFHLPMVVPISLIYAYKPLEKRGGLEFRLSF